VPRLDQATALAEFADRLVGIETSDDGSLAAELDVYRAPRFRYADDAVLLIRMATGPMVNVYVRFVTTTGHLRPLPKRGGGMVHGYLRGDASWCNRWRGAPDRPVE